MTKAKNNLLNIILGMGLIGIGSTAWTKTDGSISTKNRSQSEYPKMATVSSSDAAKAATDKVPGDIMSIALENEEGSLVYAVEVVSPQSGLHEINVDAGNGKILSDETKDRAHRKPADDEEDDD